MKTPLLIYHDANDANVASVAQNESHQIVEAICQNGSAVKYILLENEGHGQFAKLSEQRMQQDIVFLEQFL